MKKLSLIAMMFLLVPVVAGAQVKPLPPPPPPPPTAPPAPPAPPVVIPSLNGTYMLDAELLQERARALTERAMANTFGDDMAQTLSGAMGQTFSQADSERSAYDRGQSLLSARQYEQAITQFEKAIAAKGSRTDGAIYWKAFAQYKLGRSSDANATLAELQKSFKDSKYLSDAKALEAEVKRTSGQAARPENEDDEDLKLLALQGLINSDPERAIPLVQGVLSSAGSLKLKDRALFVLAQSNSAQAHTILITTAKSGTPDLQLKAINYVAISRGRDTSKTTLAELLDIYNASQNDSVKRAVISAIGNSNQRGFMVSTYTGSASGQMAAARSDAARGEAAATAANTEAQTALWSLYAKESSKDLKGQILSTLGAMGASDRIIEVARSEKDAELRNRAIRSLGNMRSERSGQTLIELYPTLTDVDAKKAVISALMGQNNGEGLVAIVRKETNFELKKRVVENLTNMPKNKAAQDYLMEIIK